MRNFFEALINGILILGQDESMRGTNGNNFELLFLKKEFIQKNIESRFLFV